jgi:hypothetical protein
MLLPQWHLSKDAKLAGLCQKKKKKKKKAGPCETPPKAEARKSVAEKVLLSRDRPYSARSIIILRGLSPLRHLGEQGDGAVDRFDEVTAAEMLLVFAWTAVANPPTTGGRQGAMRLPSTTSLAGSNGPVRPVRQCAGRLCGMPTITRMMTPTITPWC